MRRITRMRRALAGVRFCDGSASISTAEQRARRRYEDTRIHAYTLLQPR